MVTISLQRFLSDLGVLGRSTVRYRLDDAKVSLARDPLGVLGRYPEPRRQPWEVGCASRTTIRYHRASRDHSARINDYARLPCGSIWCTNCRRYKMIVKEHSVLDEVAGCRFRERELAGVAMAVAVVPAAEAHAVSRAETAAAAAALHVRLGQRVEQTTPKRRRHLRAQAHQLVIS